MSGNGREARAARLFVVAGWVAAAFAVSSGRAQQATPQPDQQQPGAPAQVHTGTSSGLDADARIRNLLADHQYFQIADQLDQLPPERAQLYRGILANRDNDPKKSIELLEPLIDKVAAAGDPAQEKLLRKTLAEDYLREGDLAKAAKAYGTLETRLAANLTADEQYEIEMPVKMLPLAAADPPMTVDPCEPFIMQVSKDPLGLTDIPVFVDAQPHSWMLDPTAPFNLVSRTVARYAGLKVSDEMVTIHTLTGKPMQVHVTVIPRFTIGGRLTLHNVTAFVFEDADYFFPRSQYQVQGVLGYAALNALGSVTITSDATIEVHPARDADPPAKNSPAPAGGSNFVAAAAAKNETPPAAASFAAPAGARFFLDGDQVIVALGSPGNERMFVVDAGGQQSYLTSRYFDEHASDFAGQKTSPFALPGDSGVSPQQAYMAETVPLEVGGATVRVHYLQVLSQPLGSAALDDVYGVLGVDVLDQLRSYTFDYRTMRFSVGRE
jgi:hypothetical protein